MSYVAELIRSKEKAEERARRLQAAMNYLETQIFERKWDGTIGRTPRWFIAGPFRHEVAKWKGDTLLEAIESREGGALKE